MEGDFGSEMFNVRALQDLTRLVAFGRAMGALRVSSRAANPTACHRYIAKLHELGRLLRCYTQNIDGLQTRNWPHMNNIVLELHGSIHGLQCSRCGQSSDSAAQDIDEDLIRDGYAHCTKCQERGEFCAQSLPNQLMG